MVQVTVVSVAAETGQSMPSMVILYRFVSVTNPTPVKVTGTSPSTLPNLGLMAERAEVAAAV